jgi:hypothetical protein
MFVRTIYIDTHDRLEDFRSRFEKGPAGGQGRGGFEGYLAILPGLAGRWA